MCIVFILVRKKWGVTVEISQTVENVSDERFDLKCSEKRVKCFIPLTK